MNLSEQLEEAYKEFSEGLQKTLNRVPCVTLEEQREVNNMLKTTRLAYLDGMATTYRVMSPKMDPKVQVVLLRLISEAEGK